LLGPFYPLDFTGFYASLVGSLWRSLKAAISSESVLYEKTWRPRMVAATLDVNMKQVRLEIIGRVQGVFYRANAKEAGLRLGITGWVRNTEDGGVEALAEGPQKTLEEFIEWCRTGPPAAKVDDVKAEWGPATGEFATFSIKYD